MVTERVKKMLDCYESDNPGTKANLARILMQGKLGGTGKLLILPVDQGFEHGPARSFAPNPPAYDPHYHFQLAIDAGLSAYAAPLGFIEAGAATYAGAIPTILKVNSANSLARAKEAPSQAVTAGVQDALQARLRGDRLHHLSRVRCGLSHVRGDRRAGARGQILRACGGDLVLSARRQSLEGGRDRDRHLRLCRAHGGAAGRAHHQGQAADRVPGARGGEESLSERRRSTSRNPAARIRHVVQSCFNGKRIVVFSGGEAKDIDGVYNEARAIRDGGANGSIIGRNTFQRPREEALKMLDTIVKIYRGEA